MSATHRINVEDVNEQITAGFDSIKLYSDTEPNGTFTTLVATENLVADTLDYEIVEASPLAGTWYRYALYDTTGPVITELSPPWQLNVIEVADILLEATGLIGGFQGTCSAAGGTNTLIDEVLRDNSADEDYLDGDWFLRPDAGSALDYVRRTAKNPFGPADGSVIFIRDWVSPPEEGERYGVFQRIPPMPAGTGYSWMEALADALEEIEYQDEINLGPGTATGKDRFSFQGYAQMDADRIFQVVGRDIDENDVYHELDWDKGGSYWERRTNGFGNTSVILYPAPPTTMDVIARVWRRFDRVYRLEDQTDCPLRLAAYGTVVKVYEYLNLRDGGNRWASELAGARTRFNEIKPTFVSGGTAILGV